MSEYESATAAAIEVILARLVCLGDDGEELKRVLNALAADYKEDGANNAAATLQLLAGSIPPRNE